MIVEAVHFLFWSTLFRVLIQSPSEDNEYSLRFSSVSSAVSEAALSRNGPNSVKIPSGIVPYHLGDLLFEKLKSMKIFHSLFWLIIAWWHSGDEEIFIATQLEELKARIPQVLTLSHFWNVPTVSWSMRIGNSWVWLFGVKIRPVCISFLSNFLSKVFRHLIFWFRKMGDISSGWRSDWQNYHAFLSRRLVHSNSRYTCWSETWRTFHLNPRYAMDYLHNWYFLS